MPRNQNDPTFMRFLIDALRQGTISPEPSFDSVGRPVGATPPIAPPSVVPQFGGELGNVQSALQAQALRRQQMMQQMGQ